MKQLKSFFVIAASAVLVLLTIETKALAKENLKVVPNQRVCMVTNMVFPRDQIPVAHGGKTYYGCCQNCKQTLAQDASARTAQDPVTKRIVDKATAVIAAREDGSVIYFNSRASLQKYQTRRK